MASKLLSGTPIGTFVIATAVLIDDTEVTDAAIESAVATVAEKLMVLKI